MTYATPTLALIAAAGCHWQLVASAVRRVRPHWLASSQWHPMRQAFRVCQGRVGRAAERRARNACGTADTVLGRTQTDERFERRCHPQSSPSRERGDGWPIPAYSSAKLRSERRRSRSPLARARGSNPVLAPFARSTDSAVARLTSRARTAIHPPSDRHEPRFRASVPSRLRPSVPRPPKEAP